MRHHKITLLHSNTFPWQPIRYVLSSFLQNIKTFDFHYMQTSAEELTSRPHAWLIGVGGVSCPGEEEYCSQ